MQEAKAPWYWCSNRWTLHGSLPTSCIRRVQQLCRHDQAVEQRPGVGRVPGGDTWRQTGGGACIGPGRHRCGLRMQTSTPKPPVSVPA